MSFDRAVLVRSNLGGLGGRCATYDDAAGAPVATGLCLENVVPDENTPQNIYYQYLGVDPATGDPIDMQVDNETEYRAWNVNWNGIKQQRVSDVEGFFGVTNLLGPRAPEQTAQWDPSFTFVQLQYSFIRRSTGEPYVIDKSYFTFYDFDTGAPRFDGSRTQVEIMQAGPSVTEQFLAPQSEIEQYPDWEDFLSEDSAASFATRYPNLEPWPLPINAATTYGVGKDNPISPYDLSAQQINRSVMITLDRVSRFSVRYSISVCCTTGRNFLMGGYSEIVRPLCPYPPASPPATPRGQPSRPPLPPPPWPRRPPSPVTPASPAAAPSSSPPTLPSAPPPSPPPIRPPSPLLPPPPSPSEPSPSASLNLACTPRESFTPMSFDRAVLVRSNLGGLGGRCATYDDAAGAPVATGLCLENVVPDENTPQNIYYQYLGVDPATGDPIDMQVDNETEYRAWNVNWNGIKQQRVSDVEGFFGVTNLLGPRAPEQTAQWDPYPF